MNALKTFFYIKIPENRIFGLDIVRAYAILTVVIFHGEDLLPKEVQNIISVFIVDGVSVFFCLSGFLIGKIFIESIQNERMSISLMLNFWKRRWLRTLPNYFLVLIVLLLIRYFGDNNFSIFNYSKYFIFSQNLFQVHPSFFQEAWSLSVEEWFYFLIPIALYLLVRIMKIKTNSAVLIYIFSTIFFSLLYRYYTCEFILSNTTLSYDNAVSIYDRLVRKRVVTRLDSISVGVLGAYFYINYKEYWNRFKYIFFLVGIVLFLRPKFMGITHENLMTSGYFQNIYIQLSIVPVITLLTLPLLSTIKNAKGIVGRTIQRISLISYSMYLLNLSIVRLGIINNLEYSNLTKYTLYWVITMVLSILLYKYFELPILKWRDKNGKQG